MADSTAVKALSLLLALGWLIASAYYVTHGYKTRKDAIRQIEAEKEGTYVPPTIKAEARLPRSLEEKLVQIAGREADRSGFDDAEAGPADALGATGPTGDDKALPATGMQEGVDPARQAPPAPTVAGSLFDDPTESDGPVDVPARETSGGTLPIATCLEGISLPCDLVPLVQAGEFDRDPSHLVLITTGFDPSEVARSLRDALVAIGYDFRSTGVASASASRGATHVAITIHDNPSAIYDGSSKRFPSAGIGSVVIELNAG